MAVDPRDFYDALVSAGLDFYTGVPDSLLKNFCACVTKKSPRGRHVIAANEGSAIGAACGYYLASGHPGVVYMQNSGIGNAVNPLLSLADKEVYSIPLLLVVGWRGEPGVHDEPQHVKQGRVTPSLLDALDIEYEVLSDDCWRQQVGKAIVSMREESVPYALIVRKGLFGSYPFDADDDGYPMTREEALEATLATIPQDDFIVSTTGKTSREVFEMRESYHVGHERDFLTVGSMGHASSLALGMSLGTSSRIWCIDGDGALLMHMGALPVIALEAGSNLKYIVNVNGAHESVGGQPTVGLDIDIPGILRACGFSSVEVVTSKDKIVAAIERMSTTQSPSALVLYTKQGSRADLGRPTISPDENKKMIMSAFGGQS